MVNNELEPESEPESQECTEGMYGIYGKFGLYGQFGLYGPYGTNGRYSIYGEFGKYGRYGIHGEFSNNNGESEPEPNNGAVINNPDSFNIHVNDPTHHQQIHSATEQPITDGTTANSQNTNNNNQIQVIYNISNGNFNQLTPEQKKVLNSQNFRRFIVFCAFFGVTEAVLAADWITS